MIGMVKNCIYINIFLRYYLVFIIYDAMLQTFDILVEAFKVFRSPKKFLFFEYLTEIMLFHAIYNIMHYIQIIKLKYFLYIRRLN